MFELSVFSNGQKITLCEWTNFWCPIQCAWFFCLMSSTQINFRAQQLQKNSFLFALKLKTSPVRFLHFMKIENWLFAAQILWKYQNLWNVSIKIGEFFFKDSFFKAQFCSCEGQNTKVLCQFYDWGRSHSQDFTSAMKKGWSLLSQSFQTEIS